MKLKTSLKLTFFLFPVCVLIGIAVAFCSEKLFSRRQLQIWGAQVGGVLPLMVCIAFITALILSVLIFCAGVMWGGNEKSQK